VRASHLLKRGGYKAAKTRDKLHRNLDCGMEWPVAQTILSLSVMAALVGCTSLDVKRLPPQPAKIDCVCIKKNADMNVDDLVQVVQERFAKHGLTTKLIDGPMPADCHYMLEYTADRWWDLAPYMVDARLTITKDGAYLSSGHYHLNGHGGLDLGKYAGTASKLNPVIDQMLQDFHD
jgi:hypothetical protein